MTFSVRNKGVRWHAGLPLHLFLAVMVAINGAVLLWPGLVAVGTLPPDSWLDWLGPGARDGVLASLSLSGVVRVVLGAALVVMAAGLLFRARLAWTVALLLLVCSGLYHLFNDEGHLGLSAYSGVLVAILLLCRRHFDQFSLAAGSLFAVLGITSLLAYSVLGALYFGTEFEPNIVEVPTAFYFSIVSMATVGYGDITPQTMHARLFTTSIIILGITVFATSISAIAGPIIRGRIQRLVKGKLRAPVRKDHIIIAGVTPLAQNVYRSLLERGHHLTVVVPPDTVHDYPSDADIIVGDPTDAEVLRLAGVAKALYVLALRDDDSENAFIVLATRESGSAQTRTVALVNSATHLNKIRQVAPDVVFSLQSLGAEILARMVSGQPIGDALITEMLLGADKA